MKGRLFMKSIKYQSIAQQCSDGQKNVQSWKKYSCSCKCWRFGCNVQLDCSVQFGYSEVGHSCSPASLGYGKRVYAQRTFIMCCTLAGEAFPLRATWLRVFEWTPLRWQQRKNGYRKNYRRTISDDSIKRLTSIKAILIIFFKAHKISVVEWTSK